MALLLTIGFGRTRVVDLASSLELAADSVDAKAFVGLAADLLALFEAHRILEPAVR
jgi:hypothetical protein